VPRLDVERFCQGPGLGRFEAGVDYSAVGARARSHEQWRLDKVTRIIKHDMNFECRLLPVLRGFPAVSMTTGLGSSR